ncbi:hypothetical protein RJ640_011445 [Escallonia rubra]|uniref:Uncharacterized protein n=1 Tax=Escallonia rubra TaxID=112253 RepID=A0AA88R3R2_9ASTE|nr:hypothetical protein RJ640_011445 [Escallonia rubra]
MVITSGEATLGPEGALDPPLTYEIEGQKKAMRNYSLTMHTEVMVVVEVTTAVVARTEVVGVVDF